MQHKFFKLICITNWMEAEATLTHYIYVCVSIVRHPHIWRCLLSASLDKEDNSRSCNANLVRVLSPAQLDVLRADNNIKFLMNVILADTYSHTKNPSGDGPVGGNPLIKDIGGKYM